MNETIAAPPPATRPRPSVTRVEVRWQIWLFWLPLGVMLATATRADPDLWGHTRFGLDWLRTRTLPSVDPYSFTQDKPWVNHEWLSEVLTAAAYAAGGSAALVLLKAAIVGLVLFLLAGRLRGASPVVSAVVLTVAAVGALPTTGTVRPQIWSLLALVLLAPMLSLTAPTLRRIAAAALLFGLWANLHGGWITGGAALGLHAVLRSIRAPREAPRWAAMGAAALLATLATPYGPGLWHFLATTVRASRPDISEWLPFALNSAPLLWVPVLGPLLAMAAVSFVPRARPPIETYAVVCLLIAAGIKVSRVGPLVCPACFVLLAPSIRQAFGDVGRMTAPAGGPSRVLFAPAVFAIVAAVSPVQRVLHCIPIDDDWAPDVEAAASLAGTRGRLWTTFNWGEYAIWHFGPALRVSIDGRRETVYSDDVLEWHRAVERADPAALERMIAAAPDYVWLPAKHGATREYLEQHGYRVTVATDQSYVAMRVGGEGVVPGPRPAFSACFP